MGAGAGTGKFEGWGGLSMEMATQTFAQFVATHPHQIYGDILRILSKDGSRVIMAFDLASERVQLNVESSVDK